MKKFNLGLEAISYQSDDFFKKLTKEFEKLIESKYRDEKTFVQIEKMVKDRFGLKVHIKTDIEYGTCVWIPSFHQNHIFIENALRENYRSYSEDIRELEKLKRLKEFKEVNTVNTKEARVSGLFSEIKSDINLNIEQLSGMMPEEITAVYLHEVGHLFTWYENITRISTCNMVMLEACAMAEKNKPIEEKKIYIKEAEKTLNVKESQLNDILQVDDSKTVFTLFLSKINQESRSGMGSYFYDAVTCEQMADQFVSRLGGGRHLLTGLDHLNKKWGTKVNDYHDAWVSDIVSTLTLFGLGSLIGIILGTAVSAFIVTTFFIPAFMILVTYMVGTGKRDHTYDDDKVRLTRMRNDLIAILKTNPPENVKKHLIKEIELCDDVLVTYVDYKSMLIKVSDFIFKTNRNANKVYELQRDLEMINFNPLFVKSQKLSLV